MKLHGKTALVTGAGRGIGRAIALAFAGEGCAIAAAARTADQVEETARQVRDTGARALRGVVEEFMLELMYELPDQDSGGKYVIDEDIVNGKASLFNTRKKTKKDSA